MFWRWNEQCWWEPRRYLELINAASKILRFFFRLDASHARRMQQRHLSWHRISRSSAVAHITRWQTTINITTTSSSSTWIKPDAFSISTKHHSYLHSPVSHKHWHVPEQIPNKYNMSDMIYYNNNDTDNNNDNNIISVSTEHLTKYTSIQHLKDARPESKSWIKSLESLRHLEGSQAAQISGDAT